MGFVGEDLRTNRRRGGAESQEIAMGTVAHPVGVRAEGQEGGLGAEVAEEFTLGLGVGGGTRLA